VVTSASSDPQPRPDNGRSTGPDERARSGFTGRKRRSTRPIVKVADFVAKNVICAGGMGVVLAFAGIVLFIGSVVIPLFRDARFALLSTATLAKVPAGPAVAPPSTQPSKGPAPTQPTAKEAKPIAMGMDENLATLWVLDGGGDLSTYRAAGGQFVSANATSKQDITSVSNNRSDVAIGYSDGTVRVGQFRSDVEYLDPSTAPDVVKSIPPGQTVLYKDGVAMTTGSNQIRVVRTVPDLSEPIKVGESPASPIIAVDYNFTPDLEVLAAARADGRLYFNTITKKENVMTGKIRRSVRNFELPVPPAYRSQNPFAVLLGLNGRLVFVVYPDGRLLRYSTDNPEQAFVAEEVNLLPAGQSVSAARMLLGSLTIIVADSTGGLAGWFPAPSTGSTDSTGSTSSPQAGSPQAGSSQANSTQASTGLAAVGTGPADGFHMVRAHDFPQQSAPVVAIGTSARDRQFVTADAKGDVVVCHMTSGTMQGHVHVDDRAAVALVAMSPKNDAVAVLDEAREFELLHLDNPHPDGKMAQLFTPIWYEGYPAPSYTYQSSAGTDDAELKLSLVPLIFGTMKATFYAMLFAVPIAILSALYTSEFMQPRVRTIVKPLVEMMASLPSVVLGFIAALVLAPYVQNVIVAVLLAFVAVPLGLVLFGYVWQVLPTHLTLRLPGWARFGVLLALVVLMLWVSFRTGPWVERWVFYGDFKGWLDRRVGRATPGWAVMLSPLFLVAVVLSFNRWVKPRLPAPEIGRGRLRFGIGESLRSVALFAIAVSLATLTGWILSAAGFDLRGHVIGSYVQRNSLILGLVMGFAIIPIIYTLSEDALASVPDTLRSAALAAGATPWQAALKVVVPVALSGIFSACMIGFGRAAGETMVVLMASGRTPIMDMNIFNGLSALSANIATELPEAPVNSTHYRVLFMSAVVLFAVTFLVNTTAEIVRLRYRKRAYQL
jgi:phosphate transport system permease protein